MNFLIRKFERDIKEQDFSKMLIYIIKSLSPNVNAYRHPGNHETKVMLDVRIACTTCVGVVTWDWAFSC
jgi:hypothetical protein